MAHDFDPDVPQEETLQAFDELVRERQGRRRRRLELHRRRSSPRRSSSRALEGLVRYEWAQNAFSLLEQGDRETVFPLCHEHGLGYTPFGPLAGGWLTGKYRRGEPPPPGSRMTMRPEGSERFRERRDVRRARGARARARRARGRRWPRSHSPGCCTCPRSPRSSSGRTASRSSRRSREALDLRLAADERHASRAIAGVSVLVLVRAGRPRGARHGVVHRGDGGGARGARA